MWKLRLYHSGIEEAQLFLAGEKFLNIIGITRNVLWRRLFSRRKGLNFYFTLNTREIVYKTRTVHEMTSKAYFMQMSIMQNCCYANFHDANFPFWLGQGHYSTVTADISSIILRSGREIIITYLFCLWNKDFTLFCLAGANVFSTHEWTPLSATEFSSDDERWWQSRPAIYIYI